jgi:single-strand DNA-binding protein
MANDLNLCHFIGRLGRDPEIKYTPDGKAVANLSIACGQKWKDKNTGEKQEKTEWVKLVAFGKLAEIIGQYCKKGGQIYAAGRLQTRKWQDKDGHDRYTTEVVLDTMQLLGSKRDSQEDDAGHSSAAPADTTKPTTRPASTAASAQSGDFDDDIQF